MPPVKQIEPLDRTATADGGQPPYQKYWRSLEHLAGSSEVEEYLAAEFPKLRDAIAGFDRRSFVRLVGASMALAGIAQTGCRRWPVEEIRPHTSRPAGSAPGVAEYYATLFELDGVATGILAKSYDGRPIKIEGNPDHPLSLGASGPLAQATVLELYDPDRSRYVSQRAVDADTNGQKASPSPEQHVALEWPSQPALSNGRVRRTWAEFEAYATSLFNAHRARQGEGLALLLRPTSSPTQRRLVDELKQSMPKARWFAYQPLHYDRAWQGSRGAFGQILRCQYDLSKARVIVCFESDLLGSHPAHLKYARDWSAGRRSADEGSMNRLICVESGWSITGSVADIRVPLVPTRVDLSVRWIAARLGILPDLPEGIDNDTGKRLDAIAQELTRFGSSSVLVGGPSLSAEAHQIVHAINAGLGNVGSCVKYCQEPLADDVSEGFVHSIRQLSEQLLGNVIETLVIVGGNPIYDAPADAPLNLSSTANRPLVSIHLSLYENETSQACTWHLPATHGLESWNDGRAWDGTYTLGQPLIRPLYAGKSALELLSLLAGKPNADTRSMVRTTYEKLFPASGAKGWESALHNGFQDSSQFAAASVSIPQLPSLRDAVASASLQDGMAVRFVGDIKTHDGQFANNAWLQELPEPLTKLTWDNAAQLSKMDADRLGIENGDVIRITVESRADVSIEIPALVMPGQAVGCITLPLGYGRTHAGRIGNDVGANIYPLRTCDGSYSLTQCSVSKTGRRSSLATTQLHHLIPTIADYALKKRLGEKGEPGLLVHECSFAEYQRDPHSVHGHVHAVHAAPLFDQPSSFGNPHRWAMSIDLNACIGCSSCTLACQAENNIPVVGKENVLRNREMHWMRIDRYFKGELSEPDVVHVPTACVHCENAPCEQVCPVAATVHDTEGINAMVYNRCIGTRYCANNCPYKVRRFNYFDYQATDPREPAKPWFGIPDRQPTEDISILKKMVHNPDVTVRMRGVMEKCTYCVQRVVEARIAAKNDFSRGQRDTELVRDGEVQTACQATCPTQAIVFGDLNDPNSAVSVARRNVRSYEMLAELNLGARTTYLAKIRNRET